MNYTDIEVALTAYINTIKDGDTEKAFELVRPYESDFEGFALPEDFTPRSKYAFIDVLDEQGSSIGFASTAQLKGTGQTQIFVGSHARDFAQVKKEVHQRLKWLRDALHNKPIEFSDGSTVKFQWINNAKFFSLPNHVCWTANFQMTTYFRIDNV
jgi:hypothetical protein